LFTGDVPELIVVGAVDHFGIKTAFSQGIDREVTTYALGENVICAGGDGTSTKIASGTSFGTLLDANDRY